MRRIRNLLIERSPSKNQIGQIILSPGKSAVKPIFNKMSLVCELSGRVSTSFVRFAIQSCGEKLGEWNQTKRSLRRKWSG
jgi:hypothetical protein